MDRVRGSTSASWTGSAWSRGAKRTTHTATSNLLLMDVPFLVGTSILPEDLEPPLEQPLDPWRQLTAAPGVGGLLHHLALGGVGVDDAGDLAQADPLGDRQAELADHVTGVLGHQRRAEDAVLPLLQVHPQEALGDPLQDG